MFGSLILPTTTTGAAAAALTGTRITSRSGGGGIQSSPNLSFMGSITNTNYYYYHPTMSFPSPKLLPPRTGRRIRASFTTAPAPAPAASDTNTTQLNLYQILRIKQNASSLEIKTAYRKLAKQFHPDALPPPPPTTSDDASGGARDFMAIHNAYATLSDPTERARYDLSIQIHKTRRFHRYYSSTATATATATAVDENEDQRRRRSYGRMQTTRRWETDQCW